MTLDLSRVSGSLELLPQDSGVILSAVSKASAFQAAARQITLSGTGNTVHSIGKTTASVVGETNIKPVSTPALATKTVSANTFSVLVPVSNQLLSDAAAVVNVIRNDAPKAIAEKYDSVIATGVDAPANFAALNGAASQAVTNRASFVAALGAVAANGARPTAVVLSTAMFYTLLAVTVSGTGAPAFDITDTTINGVPYFLYDSSDVEGFVGDFSRAVWGNVEGISVATSDSATITGVGNLFERNMTAIRVEARLGFQIADINNFVKITATA